MKLFLKADVDEAEVIPRARFSYIRVTEGEHVRNRMVIVRTPFKRWKKYTDWNFGPNEGWCTYTFAFFYLPRNRKFNFTSTWEPINVKDWM